MNSSIMWFTLSARDPDALASVYEHVLAWEVDEGQLTSDAGVSRAFRTLRTGGLGGSISTEEERGVVLNRAGRRPRRGRWNARASTRSPRSTRRTW